MSGSEARVARSGSRIPFGRNAAFALAALGGAFYFLGFPGFGLWPFAFIAQAPLMVALAGQTPRRAAWLGLLNGTVMTLGGFYWLVEMLRVFSGFSTPICLFFLLVICAYQGARHAALGWLYARAELRGASRPLAYALAFATTELLYPLLFPWYAAASLTPVPTLVQVAELGGPILVGLVLVAVNVAVSEVVLARLEGRGLDRRPLVVGAAALVGTLVYGWARIRSVDARMAASDAARVGIVQANMGLMQKRSNAAEGVQRHKELTAKLKAEKNIDFVVWSESSVMYTFPEAVADVMLKERVTGGLGLPAIFGAVVYRSSADRERDVLFNTSFSTDERGRTTARYDKQYLLMFGEYLPLAETFPVLHKISPHSGRFSPGKTLDPLLVAVRGQTHKVSMLICYEDILPSFVRSAVRFAEPELLVNITNDAWFGDTAEPWQHLALAQLRAIEHRRFLVRSTNSGVSAVVDAAGRVVKKGGTFQVEALDAEIKWMKGQTVYGLVGDSPYYLMSATAFFLAFRRRRAPAKTADS